MINGHELRECKNGMFGERATTTEAYEYAMNLLKAEGVAPVNAMTAIMVYHNSLLESLAKSADKQEEA